MIQLLVLLVLVAIAVFFLRRAANHKNQPVIAAPVQRPRPAFHCVEVQVGVPACQAAQHLGNTRFLSGQAPALPVDACDESACSCRYIHHDDRRDDVRRSPYGHWSNMPNGLDGERRTRRDRRGWDGGLKPMMTR